MERCINNAEFIEELRGFLYRAQKHGYGGAEKPIDIADGGHTLSYKEGDWEYIDTWYGGEPFSGLTKITYQGVVCWTMVYRGEVKAIVNKHSVYACLRPALEQCDPKSPWRGPEVFVAKNGLRYINQWKGNIDNFEGEEFIYDRTIWSLYSAHYLGGLVDLR